MSEQKEEYTKTIYKYDGKPFDEIAGFSDKKMQEMLASFFPEVANAKISEEIKNGVRTVTFTKQAGRLGGSAKIAEEVLRCQPVKDIVPKIKELINDIYRDPLDNFYVANREIEKIIEPRVSKNRNIIERMESVCPKISLDPTLIA